MTKLSILVVTRNSGGAVGACMDSVAAAVANAALADAELIVVDNGSSDDTAAVIRQRAAASPMPVELLLEPWPGRARALNRGLRAAAGDLLAFTDDDCILHHDHVNDLLRHAAADTGLVLRGGRVELGDPTDLPHTILTHPGRIRLSRAMGSARHACLPGTILGCNMTMRRALYERVGPFDEAFGPGSRIGSGDDSDYVMRAYLAGAVIEYVPDMPVYHHHGRKTPAAIRALLRQYAIGRGGLYAKHLFRAPSLCRPYAWALKRAVLEVLTASNHFSPAVGYSYRDNVSHGVQGALTYLLGRGSTSARRRWDEDRERSPPSSAAEAATTASHLDRSRP